MKYRWIVIGAAALLALAIGPAGAQERLGAIEGVVVDASGGAMPGATVTLRGPALMGARTTVTDGEGRYRIPLVPAGSAYTLTVEMHGFSTITRPDIEVRVGQTVTIDVTMEIAGLAETVEVRAPSPVLDLTKTTRNFTIDSEAVARIPLTSHQRYADLFVMAPGVRDALDSPGMSTNIAVNGANPAQNKVYVDGIDAMDHVNGSMVTELNSSVIKEVSINTGGHGAEAGFGTGGMMNIVTRSGGNEFSGGASLFVTPQRFNGTNRQGVAPADVETYFPEARLGGPIQRDRLWFFVSEKYRLSNEGISGVTAYKKNIRSHEVYAKATQQVHSSHRLAYIFQWDKRTSDHDYGRFDFTEDATSVARFGGYMTGMNWDYQVGPRSFLQVVGSYFNKPNSTNGRNGNAPRTMYYDEAGNVLAFDGNYDRDQTNEATRWFFSGNFTQNFDFVGSHDLKLTTEFYPATHRLLKIRLNEVRAYRDSPIYGPRQLWRVQTPRPAEGVENDAVDRAIGFGIQDSWRPTRRLTVNLGARYDRNHTEVVGGETLVDYGSWSPRAGFTYALDENTVLKSSYARLGEKFALDFVYGFYPNQVVYDTATSSEVNGVLDVFTPGSVTTSTARNVDRRVPYALEFVAGIQRQLPGRIALDVSYVDRRYRNAWDTVDRNLILDLENKKFVGRVDPNYDALTDYVTNDRVQRVYRALQVWANRRLADRWQFNATYTYNIDRRDGEFGTGTAANAALQFYYGDRARDFYAETVGARHMFKLSGSYTFPGDVTAGIYYSKRSTTVLLDRMYVQPPGTLAPQVTLSNGRVVFDPLFNPLVLVAPPDDEVGRRIGGPHLLNLQVEKTFRFGRQNLRLMGLIYNLPNASRLLNYGSNVLGNPNYERISSVQPPRSGQISIAWDF